MNKRNRGQTRTAKKEIRIWLSKWFLENNVRSEEWPYPRVRELVTIILASHDAKDREVCTCGRTHLTPDAGWCDMCGKRIDE